MNKIWKFGKQALLLLAAAGLILWGAALTYAYANGDIGTLRAGIKLLLVIGIMTWIHDWWNALSQR